MLACRAGWLRWPTALLAAGGRMALTNYLLQSIICTAVFDGWGLGRFGTLERHRLLYVVFAVWAAELLWSPVWLRVFAYGPAEWAWRALTYWQWPPIRNRVGRAR